MKTWQGWLVLLLGGCFLLTPILSAEEPITLENADLRVTLSPQHGGLLSVNAKKSGKSYLGSSQQEGWFRIQIPLPYWEGHSAASQQQKNLSAEKQGSDSVVITGSQLSTSEGAYPISFKLTLRLVRDNLVCRLSFQNQSQQTVDRITFPILDVPPAADSKETLIMPQSVVPLQRTFSENDVRTDHSPFDSLDPLGGWYLTDPKISAKAFNYPDTLPTAWLTYRGDWWASTP